jgi:hypothetical protein
MIIANNLTGVFTKNWNCAEDALYDISTPIPTGEVIITRGGFSGEMMDQKNKKKPEPIVLIAPKHVTRTRHAGIA